MRLCFNVIVFQCDHLSIYYRLYVFFPSIVINFVIRDKVCSWSLVIFSSCFFFAVITPYLLIKVTLGAQFNRLIDI